MKIDITETTLNINKFYDTVQSSIHYDKATDNDLWSFKRTKKPKYIIMNNETANELIKSLDGFTLIRDYDKQIDYVNEYQGIPIAFCAKLDFGEVDIIE